MSHNVPPPGTTLVKTVTAIARCAAVFALVLSQTPSLAQTIYKCVDSMGRVTYTDDLCSALNNRRQVPRREPPSMPAQRVRTVPPAQRPPITRAPDEPTLYARAVAELEQQYPMLNPDSPTFDRALTQQVLRQKQVYVQKAYGEDYALRVAVADVMTPNPVSPVMMAQTPTEPRAKPRGNDAIVEASAKGAIGGVLLAAFAFAFFLIRWLWRRSRAAAVQVAYIAGNTSAKDIARAAGGAAAKVERKTAGVMEAFREGRQDAEKRRD